MTRRIAVSVALLVAVTIGLAALMYAGPASATGDRGCSASNYPGGIANHPGGNCHLTTTTAKPTTTTVKPTTTTVKPTTTTAKPSTTTTKAGTPTTTVSSTTTTLQPTTTSASTTTTTLMPGAGASPSTVDPEYLYGSPDDRKTMEAARAIVAGLALSGIGGPPDGSGTAGGPPADGAAGVTDVATGDAAGPEDPIAGDAAETRAATGPSYYYVSPVAIIFLLVYATSFILYKTKSIQVATHRKIWNLLLLGTFLVTGAFGLILAIGISQNPPWVVPQWLLFWHVEIGIMMAFISFFHLAWLASTKLRSSPAERVPAAIR